MEFVLCHVVEFLNSQGFRVVVKMEEQPLSSGFDGARFLDAEDAKDFSEIAVGDAAKSCR